MDTAETTARRTGAVREGWTAQWLAGAWALMLTACGGGGEEADTHRVAQPLQASSAAAAQSTDPAVLMQDDLHALRYIASYRDLIEALGASPSAARAHYTSWGRAEGRTISFDPMAYVASYPDLIQAFGADTTAATRHFIVYGDREGRRASFDAPRYLASYADLIQSIGLDTAAGTRHYVETGWSQGRSPSFDTLRYVASYADLIEAFALDGTAAARHYVAWGFREGRTLSFDAQRYVAGYADLQAAFGSDTAAAARHFIAWGYREGRSPTPDPVSPPSDGAPAAGYASGRCAVPAAAQALSVASPTRVIGNGTPASCTSQAVVSAVAQGGVITFNCGPAPVTITMTATAKVFNDKPDVVLDGGGLVTLSGGGVRRILYQNTCDPAQVWTSPQCNTQDTPRTTLQNITLVDGNSIGQTYGQGEVIGGGAVFVRGGRFKIVNARFFRNQCDSTGPDLGGAAVRAFGMSPLAPVYVVNSTFGGAAGYGNSCSNGAGLSGLGASFAVYNSLFSHNQAIGRGANPAAAGTPGGGSGGAIYMDGNAMDLSLCGSHLHHNTAQEGGGAIFYVSNDRSGTMSLTDSRLEANPSGAFETVGLPGIFVLARSGQPVVTNTTFGP